MRYGIALPNYGVLGTTEKIRADVAAYAAAGVDYLVLSLHHATTIDDTIAQLDRVTGDVFS